jgi:hypothetical protein
MSVSNIASNSDQINQIASVRKQRQQDFKELSNALQTGDLSAAQDAFSALQQLFSPPASNSQTQTSQQISGRDSVTADISALGQALQSGDLTTAQTDFSQLQKDIQSIGQKHHHHHKASASAQDTSTTATSSGNGLDQLLASLTASNTSSTDSTASSTGTRLQQLMSLLQTLQASAGTKVDTSSVQTLLGSSINVSA